LAGPLFGPNPSAQLPNNAFSVVNNFKTPRYHNINLSLQREVARNSVLQVGYSGQRGRDLLIYQDINAAPLGAGLADTGAVCLGSTCDAYRPLTLQGYVDPSTGLPLFRQVIQATNRATSQYDSLQASFNQRGWHGFDTQYNLTWSKCYDDNSVNRGGGGGDHPQINNENPVGSTALGVANIAENRGLCDHDVRLNFNVGGVYAIPKIRMLGERFGDGWHLSTIYTAPLVKAWTVVASGHHGMAPRSSITNAILTTTFRKLILSQVSPILAATTQIPREPTPQALHLLPFIVRVPAPSVTCNATC
jgi:hypothetical protein